MCTAISSVSEALRVGVGMDVLGLVSTATYSVDEKPCSRGVDALQSLAPTRSSAVGSLEWMPGKHCNL